MTTANKTRIGRYEFFIWFVVLAFAAVMLRNIHTATTLNQDDHCIPFGVCR